MATKEKMYNLLVNCVFAPHSPSSIESEREKEEVKKEVRKKFSGIGGIKPLSPPSPNIFCISFSRLVESLLSCYCAS